MLERTFAHVYDTGGMRRTHLRSQQNIVKRLLIHVGAFNLSLLLRQQLGVGTPRGLQGLWNRVLSDFWVLWMALGTPWSPGSDSCRARKAFLALGARTERGLKNPIFTTGCYSFRGKKRRESSNSTNRTEAMRLLRQRMGEMGRGRLVGPSAERITFDDLKQMLKSDYQTNGRMLLKRAEVALKALEGFFGLYRALDITTDRITEYIRTRQEAGVKPATIHYDLSILKRMFTLAVQAEKLDRRPHIPSIEVRNVRTGFFSESEFLSVLSRLPEDIKPLVEFLWLTGWRVGEALNLEWRQVD